MRGASGCEEQQRGVVDEEAVVGWVLVLPLARPVHLQCLPVLWGGMTLGRQWHQRWMWCVKCAPMGSAPMRTTPLSCVMAAMWLSTCGVTACRRPQMRKPTGCVTPVPNPVWRLVSSVCAQTMAR